MKKVKFTIAFTLCVVLATTAAVCLTGCGTTKYRPFNFSVGEGYSLSYGKDPWVTTESNYWLYSVKNADGDVIATIQPNGISEDGKHLGIPQDESNVNFSIIMDGRYDFDAIIVSINGTAVPRSSIRKAPDGYSVDSSFTYFGFSYEATNDEKEFNIALSGFGKPITIGGHKWELFGVKDDNGFYGWHNSYDAGADYPFSIKANFDYTFNFKADGSGTCDAVEGDEGGVFNVAWTENNDVLNASIETGADISMVFMTQAERDALITENNPNVAGRGVIWNLDDDLHTQFLFVLDGQMSD